MFLRACFQPNRVEMAQKIGKGFQALRRSRPQRQVRFRRWSLRFSLRGEPRQKSVAINLTTEEGKALAKKLVATADIVLENMRPGVMTKLGLDYDALVKVKPDLIMLSLSGFGGTGPLRRYAAYNPCFTSVGGVSHLTGYAEKKPNTMTNSGGDARDGDGRRFRGPGRAQVPTGDRKGPVYRLVLLRSHQFDDRRPDDGLCDEPSFAKAARQYRRGHGAAQRLPLCRRRRMGIDRGGHR